MWCWVDLVPRTQPQHGMSITTALVHVVEKVHLINRQLRTRACRKMLATCMIKTSSTEREREREGDETTRPPRTCSSLALIARPRTMPAGAPAFISKRGKHQQKRETVSKKIKKNPRRGTFAPSRNRTLEAQNITQKDSRVVQEDSAAELNSKRLPGCAGRLGTHQPNSHDTVQQATPVWCSGFPRNFSRKSVFGSSNRTPAFADGLARWEP